MMTGQNELSVKAMILAAGLGTRLRPVTDKIPKALFEVNGETLLRSALRHLDDHGIKEIIVNVHHFADQIIDYLKKNNNFGLKINISDERDELLDTGGGVKKARGFFPGDHPFIVRNVDIISDMDLSEMVKVHKHSGALATLAVRERETSRYFLFDEYDRLCGWTNIKTGEITEAGNPCRNPVMLAFSGIQVLDPGIFDYMPEAGKFSLTELYLSLARQYNIKAFHDKAETWLDAGKQHQK